MSNIYIQEPPASGKVLLKTTVGDIDIELWTREAPKACRNFIQLCMEGYYNNTIFHRVVKQFIVQGGDPTGTGQGGDSIYGHPFKDEFHSRLRFCRRGLVAMANAGKDDNGSQFFFTLASTPELQNKHTIFGKVGGDTIYNMIKLGEGLVDEDDRPNYPQKILKTEILSNPFSDIVPRKSDDSLKEVKEKKKNKAGAVKNFKLLSFGEEAEEDEEETIVLNKKYAGKGKSAHDTLLDPKLSSEPAIEICSEEQEVGETQTEEESAEMEQEKREVTDRIKNKLQNQKSKGSQKTDEQENEEEENFEYVLGQSRREERQKKAEEVKKEIRDLKRGVKSMKMKREEEAKQKEEEKAKKEKKDELKNEFFETQKQYREMGSKIPKAGKSREAFTEEFLNKFKKKLQDAKEKKGDQKEEGEKSDLEDENDESWKAHTLRCEQKNPVLAKDASTKSDDWFEIHDPRNPINKRRRGETSGSAKKQKK